METRSKIEAMGVISLVIMLTSLTAPFGYGYNNNQESIEFLTTTSYYSDTTKAECSDKVWINKLSLTNYNKLMAATKDALSSIAGVGNYDAYATEQAQEQAGVPEDTGVATNAKDMMVVGPTGESALLYDIQQHVVINPKESCQMSNLQVQGKFAVATKVEDTRFCAKDKTGNAIECERGLTITGTTIDELNEGAEVAAKLQEYLKANDGQGISKLATGSSATKITEAFAEEGYSPVPSTEEELQKMPPTDKTDIVSTYTKKIGLNENLKKTFDSAYATPPNIVTSKAINMDYSIGAGDTLFFMLSKQFSQFLRTLWTSKGADEFYNTMMTVNAVIGFTEMGVSAAQSLREIGQKAVAEAAKAGGKGVVKIFLKTWLKTWIVAPLTGAGRGILRALRGGAKVVDAADALSDSFRTVKILDSAGNVIDDIPLDQINQLRKGTDIPDKLQDLARLQGAATATSSVEDIEKINAARREVITLLKEQRGIYDAAFDQLEGTRKIVNQLKDTTAAADNIADLELQLGRGSAVLENAEDAVRNGKPIIARDLLTDTASTITRPSIGTQSTLSGAFETGLPGYTDFAEQVKGSNTVKGLQGEVKSAMGKFSSVDGFANLQKEFNAAKLKTGTGSISNLKRFQVGMELYGGGKISKLIKFLGTIGATPAGKMMLWGSYGVTMSTTLLQYYNNYFQDPYFETSALRIEVSKDKLQEGKDNAYFELNTNIDRLGRGNVKLSGAEPSGGVSAIVIGMIKFIGSGFKDFNTGGTKGPPQVEAKLNSLGSLVFIFDTMADGGTKNKAGLNSITSLGSAWNIFSVFPDPAAILIYEHPGAWQVYDKKLQTALWGQSKNLDIDAILTRRSDATSAPVLGTLRFIRKISEGLLIAGAVTAIPYGATLALTSIGPAIWKIGITIGVTTFAEIPAISYAGTKFAEDLGSAFTGKAVEMGAFYSSKQKGRDCAKFRHDYVGDSEINLGGSIGGAKTTMYATGYVDMAANIVGHFFPPARIITVPVGLIASGINIGATAYEANQEEQAFKDMTNCAESEFFIGAHQSILTQGTLKDDFLDILAAGLKETFATALSSLGPESGKVVDQLFGRTVRQVMHITGESDGGMLNLLGENVYDMHFQEADLKWWPYSGCTMDICTQDGKDFKCVTSMGYFWLDDKGKLINEEPLSQLLALHMDMEAGTFTIASKVIEIQKDNDRTYMIEVEPGKKPTIPNDCLTQTLKKFFGVSKKDVYTEEYISKIIGDGLGELNLIEAADARIWIDKEKNEFVLRFKKDVCGNAAFSTVHMDSGSYMEFSNDGTIDIVNPAGDTCSIELGDEGVITFDNALLRRGFSISNSKWDETANPYGGQSAHKTINTKEIFHLFIETIGQMTAAGEGSNLDPENPWQWELCDPVTGELIDPGTLTNTIKLGLGYRLVPKFISNNNEANQMQEILNDQCWTNYKDQNNNNINFDGKNEFCMTYTQGEETKKICYKIEGSCTKNNLQGIKANILTGELSSEDPTSVPTNNYECIVMQAGADGAPTATRYPIDPATGLPLDSVAGAPMPFYWGTGPNGWGAFDGQNIKINAEIPFTLNPAIQTQGLGGGAFFTASLPPWGGTAVEQPGGVGPGGGGGQQNMFAQLPSTPTTPLELFAFIITILGGVVFIRISTKKRKLD